MITKGPGNARFRASDGNLSRSARLQILERRQGPNFNESWIRSGDNLADKARILTQRAVPPASVGGFTSLGSAPGCLDNPDGLTRLSGGHLFSQPLGIEVKPFYSEAEMSGLLQRFPGMSTDQILRELTRLGNQSWKI